jgi:hypothetical protein
MSSYYANENHRIQECQEAVNKANRVKKEQMELNTTTDQWREELERLGAKCQSNDPGETIQEIMKRTGFKKDATKKYTDLLVKLGRCTEGTGTRIDKKGRKYYPTVYQLK